MFPDLLNKALEQLLPTKMGSGCGCCPGPGSVTDVGQPDARVLVFTSLRETSGLGRRGIEMPSLLFSWAARVKPLDKNTGGNLCSGLWGGWW